MLQTSPYWFNQLTNYSSGSSNSLSNASPISTTPFDLYYRQAAAVLQKPTTPTSPLYPHPNRFNPLYLSSLASISGQQQQPSSSSASLSTSVMALTPIK